MKALICEMCGGTEIIKQDGLYVCQYCGTKYSVDEAKKLFADGPVPVKIDTTDSLKKLYHLARRALENNDNEQAEKYYNLILLEKPDCWESLFYSSYCSAWQNNIAGIVDAVRKVNNCLPDVFHLMNTSITSDSELEHESGKIISLVGKFYLSLFEATMKHYKEFMFVDSAKQEKDLRTKAIATGCYNLGDFVESAFSKRSFSADAHDLAVEMWGLGITTMESGQVALDNKDRIYKAKASGNENATESNDKTSDEPNSGCGCGAIVAFVIILYIIVQLIINN